MIFQYSLENSDLVRHIFFHTADSDVICTKLRIKLLLNSISIIIMMQFYRLWIASSHIVRKGPFLLCVCALYNVTVSIKRCIMPLMRCNDWLITSGLMHTIAYGSLSATIKSNIPICFNIQYAEKASLWNVEQIYDRFRLARLISLSHIMLYLDDVFRHI